MCFGTGGILDCYASEGLRLVQWLGPVDVLQIPDPEDEPSLAMVGDTRLTGSACSIVRLQEGHGAALRLELDRDFNEEPAVLIQVVLQFVDPSIGYRLVQRVTTKRLPVVKGLGEFLQGVDPGAAAVVMAKRIALDAKKQGALVDKGRAEGIRYSLRAQLALIASRCCKEVQLSSGLLGFGAQKNPSVAPGAHPPGPSCLPPAAGQHACSNQIISISSNGPERREDREYGGGRRTRGWGGGGRREPGFEAADDERSLDLELRHRPPVHPPPRGRRLLSGAQTASGEISSGHAARGPALPVPYPDDLSLGFIVWWLCP